MLTLAALGFLMSLSSALVLPTYLGYDEPQHLDMVLAVASGEGWPGPGERGIARGVVGGSNPYYGPQLRERPLQTALTRVPPRGERLTVEQLGGGASAGGNPNQIVQHPPLYYGVLAVGVRALGAQDLPYDQLVLVLRAMTALIVAPLPVVAWAIARRLRAGPLVAASAAALALSVPGLTRVAGLVNNDGLLVITTAGLLLGLVHVATGDLSRRTAVAVGLLTGLALLSKGFALPLPLLVVLAYALGAAAAARRIRTVLAPLGLALAVGFVTGGLWWIRNVVLYGALQPSGYGPQALARIEGPPRAADNPAVLDIYLTALHDRLARTFWAGVGIASQPTVTKTGGTVLFALLAIVVLVGLALGVRRQAQRGQLAILLLPVLLALAIVVQGSYGEYVEHARLPGLQGRYLYSAMAGLAVVAALGLDRLLGPARRGLPALAAVILVGTQALHGVRLTRELWLPASGGSLRQALNGLELLSPLPVAGTRAVFAATTLTALVVLALAVRSCIVEGAAVAAPLSAATPVPAVPADEPA